MTRARVALLGLLATGACVPDAGRVDRTTDAYLRILEIEDARAPDGDALGSLLAATGLRNAHLRRTAVRALGRLERPSLAPEIAALLGDADPAVRATAAWALAQSVHGADGAGALEALLARVTQEVDANTRASLAESIGRLRLGQTERRRAYAALLHLSGGDTLEAPAETAVGVALGLEALVRGAGSGGIPGQVASRLDELSRYRSSDAASAARVRTLAFAALGPPRRLGLEQVRRALDDPDAEVRRIVVQYLGSVPPSARAALLEDALSDESPRVAIEAIRYVSGMARTAVTCGYLLDAAGPAEPPAVRVEALTALARPCPTGTAQRQALTQAAFDLDDEAGSPWQPSTSALTALGRVDPEAAFQLLPRFVVHPSPFVRAHAARAAGLVRDEDTLRQLAADRSANVRTAAVRALFELLGHRVDDVLIAQLSGADPELLLTAAHLLEGSPARAEATSALVAAFLRVSHPERETWRDPRRALLERVWELGDASVAGTLEPFLADYDAVVASDVARLLASWTNRPHEARPEPLPRARLPTPAELDALEGTTVALHLQGGATLVIETRAGVAPTNVFRFVRLARDGYFDGLTFHRWAPNFVIQGGSPGANEFAGADAYTRDEVGELSHWRGTVGISTRGRDTGDGQVFINLVHNVRLDRDHTVIGRVVGGIDALDAVLEGTVIERAEVR